MACTAHFRQMSIGKDPHRIQGKKGADEWHRRMADDRENLTHDDPFAHKKPQALRESSSDDGEMEVGGSRPGVPSRVKDALARRGDVNK